MDGPDLSVIVPVKDEAGNVGPLIDEIVAALQDRMSFEIIYVDDGSSDATAAELRAKADEVDTLVIVRHARPCGQSAAVRSGVAAARAPLIATLDGDRQNDPADLPKLIERYHEARQGDPSVRMVAGRRMGRKDTGLRRIASRFANRVRHFVLRDEASDSGCGIKLVDRQVFLALPYFDHMHRFMPALVLREGFGVTEQPVGHRPRTTGRSKYGLMDRLLVGVADLAGVAWLRRRRCLTMIETVVDRRDGSEDLP